MRERERPEPKDSRPDPVDPSDAPRIRIVRCDLCGGPVIDRHCKLVCRNCGYQRDCSDP